MSSDYKEESYELIMLLLNERTRKYKEEKHDRELPVWTDGLIFPELHCRRMRYKTG